MYFTLNALNAHFLIIRVRNQ